MIAVGIDVSKELLDLGTHQEPELQHYTNTSAGINRLACDAPRMISHEPHS